MDFLTQIFSDIWQDLSQNLNFTIIILVIASGYLLGRNDVARKLFPLSRTFRVAIVSLFVTALYGFFTKTPIAIWIASYFVAFGFHTIVIKWIERKFKTTNPEIKPPHRTTNPEIKPPKK